MNDDEIKAHIPVVITCTENRKEVCAVQNIANKQIDRSFVFDKVIQFLMNIFEEEISLIVLSRANVNKICIGFWSQLATKGLVSCSCFSYCF